MGKLYWQIARRLWFCKEALVRPWWAIMLALWTIFSNAITIRDNFFSPDTLSQWQALEAIPKLSSQTWLIGILIISLLVALEGSYRVWRREHEAHRALQDKLRAIEQAGAGVNLDVAIPFVVRVRSGLFEKAEEDAWMIYLSNVRFTNRSKTERVSLGLVLRVQLKDSPTKQEHVSLREEDLNRLGKSSEHYLRSPIDLGPQETKTGNLGFLILPMTEHAVGGSEVIDHNNSVLEITDYVSGEKMEIVASKLGWNLFENSNLTTK